MSKPNWKELAENLRTRDKNALEDFQCTPPCIESRIHLTDGRAVDALVAVIIVIEYLAEQEQTP